MTSLKNLKMLADGLFNESNYKMALCAYGECIKYFESKNLKLDNEENMEVSFISILSCLSKTHLMLGDYEQATATAQNITNLYTFQPDGYYRLCEISLSTNNHFETLANIQKGKAAYKKLPQQESKFFWMKAFLIIENELNNIMQSKLFLKEEVQQIEISKPSPKQRRRMRQRQSFEYVHVSNHSEVGSVDVSESIITDLEKSAEWISITTDPIWLQFISKLDDAIDPQEVLSEASKDPQISVLLDSFNKLLLKFKLRVNFSLIRKIQTDDNSTVDSDSLVNDSNSESSIASSTSTSSDCVEDLETPESHMVTGNENNQTSNFISSHPDIPDQYQHAYYDQNIYNNSQYLYNCDPQFNYYYWQQQQQQQQQLFLPNYYPYIYPQQYNYMH